MAKKKDIRDKMHDVIKAEQKSKPHKVVSDLVKGKKREKEKRLSEEEHQNQVYADVNLEEEDYSVNNETAESLREDAESLYAAIKEADIGHQEAKAKAEKEAHDLEAKADAIEAAEAAEAAGAAEAPAPAPKPAAKPAPKAETPKKPAAKPAPSKPAAKPAPKAKAAPKTISCGFTGPKKAYKYWNHKTRTWSIDADIWVAQQFGGSLWVPIWCWFEDGEIDHILEQDEVTNFLP